MVITCTDKLSGLTSSLSKFDYSVDGKVVTIILAEESDSITITASDQFRINKVEVFYAA